MSDDPPDDLSAARARKLAARAGPPADASMRGDALLRHLLDSVRDYAIFSLDPAGHITSWNRGARRIKGYSAVEVIGRHFSLFYDPEAVASGWPDEELKRAAAQGRYEDEGWRVRKDGQRIWVNVVLSAIRDEQGQLLGFSKVTRDLTERRRHEEQLREREENLRLLVEGVRDHAMFLLDAQGRIKTWNRGARRLLDYDSDEVLLDIGLPGMDGYQAARVLRALPGMQTCRIVALTGYGQESDRRAAAEAGFDAHLTKPVAPEELVRVIDTRPTWT